MANEGFLNNTQLDFLTYKNSLKQYLSQQSQFQDYDFEGSNLSVLLDLLAYNTYHNAIYLNMVGSEMFMDTAQLRESIVSHAKELNYVPRSRAAASIQATILASPPDNPEFIVLPPYYSVTGESSSNTYNFSTNESVVLTRETGYAANVVFYEGTIRTEAFVVNANNALGVFELSSNIIDTSSIQVQVRKSSSVATNSVWKKTDSVFGLSPDSEVYFVQPADDFKYAVGFGNGVLGKQLIPGNVVVVTYRETAGVEGNGVSSFRVTTPAYGYSANRFTLVPSGSSSGGSESENSESIRYNAIRSFSTQSRAVTTSDYVALLKSQFPSIQTIIAYGGEEATPKRYGKVVISAKPFGAETLSTSVKEQIIDFLSDKTPVSIDPIIIDPEYLYLGIESKVKYNVNETLNTANNIRVLVTETIGNFSEDNLSLFGSDLRVSKLFAAIDAAEPSIVSNDTRVKLIKRITPTPFVPFNADWSFENELYGEGVRYALPSGHEPTISSTPFQYDGYVCYIQDDGVGNLYVYTTELDNRTSILQSSVGSVNYDTGEVKLSGFLVDSYLDSYIKIYAKLENADIEITTNKILIIDDEDVSIEVNGIRTQ